VEEEQTGPQGAEKSFLGAGVGGRISLLAEIQHSHRTNTELHARNWYLNKRGDRSPTLSLQRGVFLFVSIVDDAMTLPSADLAVLGFPELVGTISGLN